MNEGDKTLQSSGGGRGGGSVSFATNVEILTGAESAKAINPLQNATVLYDTFDSGAGKIIVNYLVKINTPAPPYGYVNTDTIATMSGLLTLYFNAASTDNKSGYSIFSKLLGQKIYLNITNTTTSGTALFRVEVQTMVSDGTCCYLTYLVGSGSDVITGEDNFEVTILPIKDMPIQAIDRATTLTVVDGLAQHRIESLNGKNLLWAAFNVITKSTVEKPTIDIVRGRQASPTDDFTYVSMLSTYLTIDENKYDSRFATTPLVINSTYSGVNTGDIVRIDCKVAGTGTTGCNLNLIFG